LISPLFSLFFLTELSHQSSCFTRKKGGYNASDLARNCPKKILDIKPNSLYDMSWERSHGEIEMNIEEIARLSGVSRSTVSRVLNNNPRVHDNTRQRVREVIEKFNYQPNLAARSLAGGRTHILGVVIPMGVNRLFTDSFLMLLTQSIALACNRFDHSAMMWVADPDYERRTIHQVLSNKFLDGVIVASSLLDEPLLDALATEFLPFVLVGRHHSQVTYIDVDNLKSAAELIVFFFQLGYRRIATICGPQNMVAGVDRLKGYKAGLEQCGLACDPALVVEGDFTEESGYDAMLRLLPLKPEAVFVASDSMAVGVLRALQESGLRAPEDVAIVGFDDMPFAANTVPPLTTVRQPVQQMGELAAETLIELIENPNSPPRHIILPTELVIRATCGPAFSV
jgi:LacI family transcriptional regulator